MFAQLIFNRPALSQGYSITISPEILQVTVFWKERDSAEIERNKRILEQIIRGVA
jgi:hypothetical protein